MKDAHARWPTKYSQAHSPEAVNAKRLNTVRINMETHKGSRMNNQNNKLTRLLMAIFWTPLFLIGCQTVGRIETTATTEAELKSSQVLPVALTEFSDQVPRDLARDLADIPTIRDATKRVTVTMGDLNNKTTLVSSDEFELVRSRIRNSLLQSQYVRDKIRFVEDPERMRYLRHREMGDNTALPNTQFDPATTFVLNGDFYRIGRGDTNQYYLEFQLVHFQTNEIVFSNRYDVKQVKK